MRTRGIQRRLFGALLWGLAWLFLAPRAGAQAGCVEIAGDLPQALSKCVSEERLCSSYLRALASDGGGDVAADAGEPRQPAGARSGPRDAVAEPLPLRVSLRAVSAQPADPAGSPIQLDAAAHGVALGQRTLSIRAGDCAAVPDALALVLVLLARQAASDPQLRAAMRDALERGQQSLGVAQTPEPPTQEAPAEERARLAPEAAEKRVQPALGSFSLGVGAGVFFGALPSAALALQLQAAWLSDPLSLRARATMLWPQQQRIVEGNVNTQDYELALEACAGVSFPGAARLSLRLCGGPRIGLMFVRARDFTLQNERATEFLMYLGVLPELGLALGPRTSLQLGAGAAAALIRPRLGIALDGGARVLTLSTPSAVRAELHLSLVQIF